MFGCIIVIRRSYMAQAYTALKCRGRECGKTLRIPVSSTDFGLTKTARCPACKTETRVTILTPSADPRASMESWNNYVRTWGSSEIWEPKIRH